MKFREFLDKHNISYKSAAEKMGLHYSNIYPLLDGLALNNKGIKSAIDKHITEMSGKYRLVKFKQAKDGSVIIKISLLPVDEMEKKGKTKSVIEWIEELAGECSAGEIALRSGYKLSSIHETACRNGISLRKG